jgi:trans-aconitate 2-methyltransferase
MKDEAEHTKTGYDYCFGKKMENVMTDWDPDKYLQFMNERTQPAIDLVGKINAADPANIIDIGCGPGNSTQILVNKWPSSAVTGLDSSKTMIEKAKND